MADLVKGDSDYFRRGQPTSKRKVLKAYRKGRNAEQARRNVKK